MQSEWDSKVYTQLSSDFNLTFRRKKRSTNAENVTVTFADVAGVDSAKLELAEVVGVMKVRS
jgi:ATP-dependent Zn protease